MEFKNLKDLFAKFQDEAVCREYLANRRWENGVAVCPKCGSNKSYNIENGKRYKCANNQCYHKFSVITGTFFENSNIPLSTWFPAVYIVASHKKGISSVQLAKDLGVTQKTSWFMLHRIRMALKEDGIFLGNNIVEADETNVGGSIANKHNKVRAEWAKTKDKMAGKSTVFAMIERDGVVVAKHVSSPTIDQIYPVIAAQVLPQSIIVTDTAKVYHKLASLKMTNHQVNHGKNEYVRDQWYTNTVEGFFSQLKRSIYGIYHKVTPKHLQKYCDETTFRYNGRTLKDPQKFALVLSNCHGRLTYDQLTDKALKNGKGKQKIN